jgi:hypothetical protein
VKNWLSRVANSSAVSVSIVFAGLWASGQFTSLGMGVREKVALAICISLTNAAIIPLVDVMRRIRTHVQHVLEPPIMRDGPDRSWLSATIE